MEEYIYRYRRIENSLAYTLNEISGGLYLAPASKLNDPFDGLNYAEKEKDYLKFPDSIDPIIKEWTIACFSEKWDNPAMWAHYAGYNGICLVYDKNKIKEWASNGGRNFSPALVSSGSKCIFDKVDYDKDMSKEFDEDQEAIFSKSEFWRYEDEWRLAFQFPMENTGFAVNSSGLIKQILIGPKIENAAFKAIIDMRNFTNKKIKIFKIELSKDKMKFELGCEIQPIN